MKLIFLMYWQAAEEPTNIPYKYHWNPIQDPKPVPRFLSM